VNPFVIEPGAGLNVGATVANAKLSVSYQWREVLLQLK
jgi:hypothetical protein